MTSESELKTYIQNLETLLYMSYRDKAGYQVLFPLISKKTSFEKKIIIAENGVNVIMQQGLNKAQLKELEELNEAKF
ncbi:hypothetical protein RCZ04_03870 [Capnocytophaga sp. HP1101]